jgi:hypothetical protein
MSFTLGLTLLAVAGAMGLAFAHGLSRCRRAPRHAARRFTSTVAPPARPATGHAGPGCCGGREGYDRFAAFSQSF